ncbi:MAG: autotransporter outer membrane beta-barrel domain-containing protein [Deltaproteobacteria bacterium]|nr:autotransporter outer membrane beta-barrel domain-containing protein [Deltaproteobacteria bacterium]
MRKRRASPLLTAMLFIWVLVMAGNASAEQRLVYKSKRHGTELYHVLDSQNPIRVSLSGPTTLEAVFRMHVYPGTSLKAIKLIIQEQGYVVKTYKFKLHRGKKHYVGVREFVPTKGRRFRFKVPSGKHTYFFLLDGSESRKAAIYFNAVLADSVKTGENTKLEKNVEPPLPPLVAPKNGGSLNKSGETKAVSNSAGRSLKGNKNDSEVLEAKLVQDKTGAKAKATLNKKHQEVNNSGRLGAKPRASVVEVGAALRTMYDENVLHESSDNLSVFLGRPGDPNFYRNATPRYDITSRVDIVEVVQAHLAAQGRLFGNRNSMLRADYNGWLYTKNPVMNHHHVRLKLGQELVTNLLSSWVTMEYSPGHYYRRLPWPDPGMNPGVNFEFKRVEVTEKKFGIGADVKVHQGHRIRLQVSMKSLDFGPLSNLDRTGPVFLVSYIGNPVSILHIRLDIPVDYMVAGGRVSGSYRSPDPTSVAFGGVLHLGLILDTWRPANLEIEAIGKVVDKWFLSDRDGDREYGDSRTDLYYDAGAFVGLEVIDGLKFGVGYTWYSNRADTKAGTTLFDVADYDGYMVFFDMGYTFKVD